MWPAPPPARPRLTLRAGGPHDRPVNLSDSQTGGAGPRRVSATEAVLAHLRDAIERGDWAIGDKLPSEAELCRELQVSRPVLREALRALKTMGLTVSRTGKGTFVVADAVQDPTFGDYTAAHLMEVRRHVEIPVAGYAALRRTTEDLDRLRGLLARMEGRPTPPPGRRWTPCSTSPWPRRPRTPCSGGSSRRSGTRWPASPPSSTSSAAAAPTRTASTGPSWRPWPPAPNPTPCAP